MTVAVWRPGSGAPVAATVLYRQDDEEDFAATIRPSLAATTTVHKVLPNGYEFMELLALYLLHRADPSGAWVDRAPEVSSDLLWISRNLIRLRLSLQNWDDQGALGAIQALAKKKSLLHPDQAKFVDFCQGFIEKVLRPLLWSGPFLLDPHRNVAHNTARAWWKLKSDLAQEIDEQLKALGLLASSAPVGSARQAFEEWLSRLKNWLQTRLLASNREVALREASGLCLALAHIHFGLNRHALAVLCCHRAADLLLFSLCVSRSLVDFTKNSGGGELKPWGGGDCRIGILSCYGSLIRNQAFVDLASRRDALTLLNHTRNHLLLTHYMGGVDKAVAKRLLTDTLLQLRPIADPDWEKTSTEIRTHLQLDIHRFFEVSGGLMGTLVAA